MVADPAVQSYVAALGARLVATLPETLRRPEFPYSFGVIDLDEIVTLALPGGPVFISRGLIALAPTEGALAAILAHELSHVALRHGTAQASAGEQYQVGAVTGRAIGAAVVGRHDPILQRAASFAVTTDFLTYIPAHEWSANLAAARSWRKRGTTPASGSP